MRTIVKNKNGILLPETLKIILAVIGIGILFTASVSFAGIFIKNNKLKQAEASLNSIKEKINSLDNIDKNVKIILTSPKDWMVISFPNEDEKILCICPEKNENKKISSCKEEGVCENFEQQINIVTVDLEDYSVSLKNIPREIFIQKEENGFMIYTEQKQVEHQTTFEDFLNTIVVVEGKEKKIYEQMIEVVEGRSGKGIEEINPPIFAEFDKLFGESGWAMIYSKEGKNYPWKYIKSRVWDNALQGENVAIALEEKIIYDNGVLKVQFRALKD